MSSKRRGRPPTYDWDKYTDGQKWVCYKGTDFDIKVASFRALVYRTATARDLGVSTSVNNKQEYVAFQFYENVT